MLQSCMSAAKDFLHGEIRTQMMFEKRQPVNLVRPFIYLREAGITHCPFILIESSRLVSPDTAG